MKTMTWCGLLCVGLAFAAAAQAQNKATTAEPKLYRWVDKNGEVHFSESLPPDFQDKKHDVLDDQGIVRDEGLTLVPEPATPEEKKEKKNELPRDASGMRRPAPQFTPEQLKVQQDSLLLLRYDSDQEILNAMDIEIKQLDYDRSVLTTAESSLLEAYRGYVREAAERQRAGIKVENKLISDIEKLQVRVADNKTQLASLRQRGIGIKKRFMDELLRYRALVAENAETQG